MELGTSARQGVALVITLIMLAVITFMAVTFLVLSQRERGSSNTAMDQKTSQMATETAFNRACAELLADALVNTNFNLYNGLKVSTNYISYGGFTPGLNPQIPNNVNYDYETNGVFPLTVNAWEANIASLEFNPRPPVFVVTNSLTGAAEFRFYLDLNRNGRFDTNILAPVVAPDGNYYSATNQSMEVTPAAAFNGTAGPILSNYFGGDPEWIGVLERPRELHSADNQFSSRYAYLVIPASGTLDLNTVYNETRNQNLTPGNDGFVRNEGTGPWELNLAAFLADLNTNIWDPNVAGLYYQYNQTNSVLSAGSPTPTPFPNSGVAFNTALSFLRYRYGGNYQSLRNASQLFPNLAAALQTGDDWYSEGSLLLQTAGNTNIQNPTGLPWAGAPNTNHYWDLTADLFDPTKTPPGFGTAVQNLGTSNDTYNSSTFYRLLSQMGTDSAPENNKLNVNWKNTDVHGNIVPGMETNLLAWTPLDFFTNAAQRMFQQLNLLDMNSNLISVTNIPIYEGPNSIFRGTNNINYYTPAVHRILQLAANIYDATHSRIIGNGPTNYPSVFRPVFRSFNGVASIAGYVEVTNSSDAFLPFLDPTNFALINQIRNQNINLYGVPWVIGAKKGFPNFNKMSMINQLQVTRKLQFTNTQGHASLPWQTNQIFEFGVSNAFGTEVWNSYANNYGRPLQLYITNELWLQLTNQFGNTLLSVYQGYGTNLFYNNGWPGCNFTRTDEGLTDPSFQVPLSASTTFTNAIYLPNGTVAPLTPPPWPVTFAPRFWMGLRYRLHYALIDTSVSPNRVVDFVNLVGPVPQLQTVDVISNLSKGMSGTRDSTVNDFADIWETNLVNPPGSGVVLGVLNLIDANLGQPGGLPGMTISPNGGTIGQFRNNLWGNGTSPSFQNQDSAVGIINELFCWSANDPLVHYTTQDLTAQPGNIPGSSQVQFNQTPPQNDADGATFKVAPQGGFLSNLGKLYGAYQPWGGYPMNHTGGGGTAFANQDLQVKDPLVSQSDNWDFPTNSLPGIGWLGRVHRGTPWQTIYMKPTNGLSTGNWINWANDSVTYTNYFNNVPVVTFDGLNSFPGNDYQLFDLFTSSVSESAASGHLNVNQTGLAAWSAVLSGVNVLTDNGSGAVPATINPAGIYNPNTPTPLAQIVQGINFTRTNSNPTNGPVFPNGFQHVGDILNTPQLTVASPFAGAGALTNAGVATSGINGDEVVERIPQQIMSLLTLNQSPRFVIYSFGQTLHPADHSLVAGGTFNGLCTNYQITAETATRAVIRVDGSPDPQYTNDLVHPHPDPLGRFYPPHIVVEQFNVLSPE